MSALGTEPSTEGGRRGMLSGKEMPMDIERHLVADGEVAPGLLVEALIPAAR